MKNVGKFQKPLNKNQIETKNISTNKNDLQELKHRFFINTLGFYLDIFEI